MGGRVVTAGVVAALIAFAAVLRLEGLERGYTSDELANVMVGDAWAVLTDVEAGVNPPLLRVLFNAPFDDFDTPWWGRRFSLGMSLAAVALAWAVARDASRGAWAPGLLAAGLLAVHPMAVQNASIYRIYAWWTATVLLHVWAMGRALDAPPGPGRRGWTAAATAAAVLLPWIHYLSVPVLIGFGGAVALGMPDRRRWVGVYAVAAVGILPMVPYVLGAPDRRVPPGEPLSQTLAKVVGLDLLPPMALANGAAKLWRSVSAAPFHWPTVMAWTMALVLLWRWLGWRGATRQERLLTGGATALVVAVAIIGRVQWVRDPVVLMMVALLGPLVAAATARVPTRWGPPIAALALAWWWGAQVRERLDEVRTRSLEQDGARQVAAALPALREAAGGAPVLVYPGYEVPSVYFYAAREHFGRAAWSRACAGLGPCFERDGAVVGALQVVTDGAGLGALLVVLDAHAPDGLGAACTPLDVPPGLRVRRCDVPAAAPAEAGGDRR